MTPGRLALAAAMVAAVASTGGAASGGADAGAHRAAGAAGARAFETRALQAAQTEPAAPDTALHRFLGSMSDSTSAFFGMTAARPDTAGLDSALSYGLAHPRALDRRGRSLAFGPDLGFNRVDGPRYGATAGIGRARALGRLEGRIGWASGPNDVLGGGTLLLTRQRGDAAWSLRLGAGRRTDGMDPDHGDIMLSMLRAFLSGTDYKHYLRRDGFEASLARETETWRAAARYRDMLESPIATSATWNLVNFEPAVIGNLQATRGHNHEFELEAAARLPYAPLVAEVRYASSSDAAGSDFEYRRFRAALAGDFAAWRRLAIVPQLSYGRLSGNEVPQVSFYFGGSNSMRGMLGASRGGSGSALARLDLIGADDLLAVARIPHPAWLPIQPGAFAVAGAVWGVDPLGGPPRGGLDWPDEEHWVSEAGAALLWRPGLPDPTGFFRFSYAWPLGPGRESARLTASYSRAIQLVRPIGE